MTDLPASQILHRKGQWPRLAHGRVTLDYGARFIRRKRLVTEQGEGFLIDLADTVSLNDGDAFELADGRLIEVVALSEPVLVITGDLTRLAWHIGNRHTPCQIESTRLLIRDDHVLAAMLVGLGAMVEKSVEAFTPDGGAYGLGRTMGHSYETPHG